MLFIAHRGASAEAPENTLASVRLAWEQKADAVEIDAQLSRDGKLVIFHDDDTARIAGVPKRVRNQTLPELKHLDVGRWKGRPWAGEKIPMLEEVVATIPQGKQLLVEIKCGPECLGELERIVRQAGPKAAQITWIGFSLSTMREIKNAFPGMEAGWIVAFHRRLKHGHWSPGIAELIRQAQAADLDILDVSANRPLKAASVEEVKQAGLKLFVWTVDSPARARKFIAAGVDGLTTNRPGWLRRAVGPG